MAISAFYGLLADLSVSTAALFSLIITSASGVLMAWIAYKQKQLAYNQRQLTNTIEVLEKNTNSIKDQLIETTKQIATAKGKAEGHKEAAEMKKHK